MRYVLHVCVLITYLFVVLHEKAILDSHILFHMKKRLAKTFYFLRDFKITTKQTCIYMPPL